MGSDKLSEPKVVDGIAEYDKVDGYTDDWSNVVELPVNEKTEDFDDLQDETQRDNDYNSEA